MLGAHTQHILVNSLGESPVTQIRTCCEHKRAKNVVKNGRVTQLTQTRTFYKHRSAKTTSALTVRIRELSYTQAEGRNTPKHYQRSACDSGNGDTHDLRTQARRNIVGNHSVTPVTQIRTRYEHEHAKTSSVSIL
jgi:hypothetical protein